ncbi:TetR/AcrR family transcriptional regulator [Frankia sp. CNm7]|nr:TetR/AcrR family transcriptional regulator [Frankia nepalensis]MBL7518073.1 TetR/AcrR family transcriptional regulator [Frankia nepalensis]
MTVAKEARRYHAPRRAEQAAATRDAIISAASTLFAERGYAATTMAAIAKEARVTPKSVYAVAEKPQLLLLAVDRAIVGDDEPVPLLDRPEMRALLAARDPRAQARLAARMGAPTLLRLYPLYRAFEQAAATDPALREAWSDYQRRRHTDTRRVIRAVADAGGLRPGLSADRATDTLWALVGWHPVALLVEERGWSQTQLTRWLEDVFVSLLGPAPGNDDR